MTDNHDDSMAGNAGATGLSDHAAHLEQAGAICLRRRQDKVEVLLINGRRNGKWGIPKGSIELNETAADAAAREAFEEAGVMGRCHEKSIGSYTYFKQGRLMLCKVAVHVIDVHHLVNQFPEVHVRTPRWFDQNEATDVIGDEGLKAILRSAQTIRL